VRRFIVGLTLIASLAGASQVFAATTPPKPGGGVATFSESVYQTGVLFNIAFAGVFPTGTGTFNGTVAQSAYGAELGRWVPCCERLLGGQTSVSSFPVAGTSSNGKHHLAGACSGRGVRQDPTDAAPEFTLLVACTTSVDGHPSGTTRLVVQAVGQFGETGGGPATDYDYTGTFVGR
jgi:hypothetical protein